MIESYIGAIFGTISGMLLYYKYFHKKPKIREVYYGKDEAEMTCGILRVYEKDGARFDLIHPDGSIIEGVTADEIRFK